MPSLTPTEIKTYAVHDHWTDINKKNDVDIISIDGEITRIKVNGEDYGGESDFITMQMTIINNTGTEVNLTMIPAPAVDHILQQIGSSAVLVNTDGFIEAGDATVGANANSTEVYKILLAKNSNFSVTSDWESEVPNNITVRGNAEKSYVTEQGQNYPAIIITGDCIITIS